MSSQIFVKAEGNGLAMYIGNANGVKIKMRAAFEACGITVTGGEGKGRSITISAEIIIDAKTQPPLLK